MFVAGFGIDDGATNFGMNGVGLETVVLLMKKGLQGVMSPGAVASDVLPFMDGADMVDCLSGWWNGRVNVIGIVLKGFGWNLRHTFL